MGESGKCSLDKAPPGQARDHLCWKGEEGASSPTKGENPTKGDNPREQGE